LQDLQGISIQFSVCYEKRFKPCV